MLFVHARCDLATAAAVIGRWSCFGYIFFTQANTEPLFRPALNSLLSSPTDHNALSAILGTQLPRPSEIAPKTNSTPTCLQANAIGNHDRLQRQAEGIFSTSATGDEDIIHKCVESFGRSFLFSETRKGHMQREWRLPNIPLVYFDRHIAGRLHAPPVVDRTSRVFDRCGASFGLVFRVYRTKARVVTR